ncbi:twin-arginine translocase TatA/TatE family subunit [bacterium]|nr:twin-arginine translocase TatA/TatE family subunit [bacterium]
MFNLGFSEILIIGVLALLLIGPRQLPEVAKVLGRMMNEFKKATADLSGGLLEMKEELKKPMQEGLGAIAEIEDAVHDTKEHVRSQLLEDEHSVTVDLEEELRKHQEQLAVDENDDKKSST